MSQFQARGWRSSVQNQAQAWRVAAAVLANLIGERVHFGDRSWDEKASFLTGSNGEKR
jgi:hypothetical protein